MADWKIPFSNTKLKDKIFFFNLVNLLHIHLPNLPPSKKESLGRLELFFPIVYEILKGTGRSFDWAVKSRQTQEPTHTPEEILESCWVSPPSPLSK